jgi:hypothetical protein
MAIETLLGERQAQILEMDLYSILHAAAQISDNDVLISDSLRAKMLCEVGLLEQHNPTLPVYTITAYGRQQFENYNER